MAIVVLGIDGLELALVEAYDLKSLKQKGYSKVALDDFSVIVSPPIWAAMITGRVLAEMLERISPFFHSTHGGFVGKIKKALPWKLRKTLGEKLGFLQNVFEGNPMEFMSTYLIERKIPTIFDECKSWHNDIPSYGRVKLAGMLPAGAFENKKVRENLLKRRKVLFKKQVGELYEILSKKDEYELIFWYTNWIDFTGHLEQGNKLKTMNRYLRINLLARQVQEQLCGNDILYIISDHGMIPAGRLGYHSNHGFFSSSTGETIRKPQEFYSLMEKNIELARA